MNLKNITIIFTLILVSACSSADDKGMKTGGGYESGPQGSGVGYGDGVIESGDLGALQSGVGELADNVADRVFFNFNSSNLDAISQQTLNRQAQWLVNNSSVSITVEGHCDERGTREFNLALGGKRANAVKDYLMQKGVDAGRINTISYGKEHPEFLGSNESAWSKNRRSVTVVN